MSRKKLMEELMNQMSEGEAKVIADFILDEVEHDLLDIFDVEQYQIIKGKVIKSFLEIFKMGYKWSVNRIEN